MELRNQPGDANQYTKTPDDENQLSLIFELGWLVTLSPITIPYYNYQFINFCKRNLPYTQRHSLTSASVFRIYKHYKTNTGANIFFQHYAGNLLYVSGFHLGETFWKKLLSVEMPEDIQRRAVNNSQEVKRSIWIKNALKLFLSKVLTSAAVYPLGVIMFRSLAKLGLDATGEAKKGVLSSLIDTVKTEGLKSLYKGFFYSILTDLIETVHAVATSVYAPPILKDDQSLYNDKKILIGFGLDLANKVLINPLYLIIYRTSIGVEHGLSWDRPLDWLEGAAPMLSITVISVIFKRLFMYDTEGIVD